MMLHSTITRTRTCTFYNFKPKNKRQTFLKWQDKEILENPLNLVMG